MKNLLLTAALAATTLLATAQNERPYLTRTLNAAAIQDINVNTSGGGITVMGGASSDATVEVFVKGNGHSLSQSEIDERLKNYRLTVKMVGNTLVCKAENVNSRNQNWKNNLSFSFKIHSPSRVDVNLTTSGGGITLSNLDGDLQFTTSGGGLDLEDLRGQVKGTTSGGGITATNCDEYVRLTTSGGSITARDCDGDLSMTTSGGSLKMINMSGKLAASTSGGSVRIEDFSGDLKTSTSGGSINLSGIEGNVKATTSAGGINAEIDQPGDYITLETSAGGITLDIPNNHGYDFDLDGNRVGFDDFSNFRGNKTDGRIQGEVNGGGTKIVAHSSAGSVRVR